MNRKTLAGLMVGVVTLSSGLGWVAASQIRSPAEVAARTAPPSASPILVPVEKRVLSTDIVTRGTGRFGTSKQITLPPSTLKTTPSLITTLPLVGAKLSEGDVILTTSGRPVFLVEGIRPTFRDLGPGVVGDDVVQLEEALVRLGFNPGPPDGIYDGRTEIAVVAWYASAGFAAIKATDAQVAVIRALEQDLSLAQIDILGAKDRIATAEADYVAAQAAYSVAVAGGDTTAAIALAQRDADAANILAKAEVASKQGALDALITTATSTELRLAERALAAALATQESTRMSGKKSIALARRVTDDAAVVLAAAETAAAAANLAATHDVAGKQEALDLLKSGVLGTPAEIRTARANLELAIAAAEVTRLAGETTIANARTGKASASVAAAAATVTATATILKNAKAALDVAKRRGLVVRGDLGKANRRAGVYVPADEIVFVESVPLLVAATTTVVGAPASGPIMTVTNSAVVIDSSLPLADAPLVKEGMTVAIDEPQLGLATTGVVSRVATSPGTDSVDGFHIYFVVTVNEAPPGLVGSSVRLTIPIKSSGGEVLTVPVSALSMTTDGSSRVQTSANGILSFVTVKPGLSATGYVGVTPIVGNLSVGDMVVVGFEQTVVLGTKTPSTSVPGG